MTGTPPQLNFTEAQPEPGLSSSLTRVLRDAVDLIFPPRCAHCGRVDSAWCERCAALLSALPITLSTRHLDGTDIAATAVHDGIVQDAVHALKYHNARQAAAPLGARLASVLQALQWRCDLLIPVPLGAARYRQRGYNQAQLIAEAAATNLALTVYSKALRRTRETRSQVGLNAVERQANMAAAFIADAAVVSGSTVVIVDDVLTTGATLSACAEACIAAGARAVYGLTVSEAQR